MRIFNDVIDLGSNIDPTLLTILNALVYVHIAAFFAMIIMIVWSWNQSPTDTFQKEVDRLSREARAEVESKKSKWTL